MKMKLGRLFLIAFVFAGGQAWAGSDDTKWIDKCIEDNKDEGQAPETVKRFCSCMNNKMGDNETQSVSQWEKLHKHENAECSKKAGWKDSPG